MDQNLWPANPRSQTVDPNVDWPMAAPNSIALATPKMIRTVKRNQLMLLRDRNPLLWEVLSPECQEAATAIIEGRKEVIRRPDKPVGKPVSKKDEILDVLGVLYEEADGQSDIGAKLKVVEMIAKIEALLNQKTTDEDRNVVINVVTGVTRG